MEFEPQDRKVVELLTKLKGANESYPSDMLAARRQAFLSNMTGAGLSLGTGSALNRSLKGGSGSGAGPLTVGKLLEVALLVAIVAEAGALAYFYRDKVADVFRSISSPSQVQEIVSPPVITSPFPDFEISEIPSSATPTGTASEMATSTQVPGVADDVTSNNNVAATLTNSTPDPNGNNGNHYGQTPKPERTKDNKDNSAPKDNPGNENNDKPPKDKNNKNQ